MEDKRPPLDLIEAWEVSNNPLQRSTVWKYKGMFHQSCAPWVSPCFHPDTKTSQYVNLEGVRLADGSIVAVGRCPLCAKVLWAETSKNY